jgi:hypothetical protein
LFVQVLLFLVEIPSPMMLRFTVWSKRYLPPMDRKNSKRSWYAF